MKQKNLFMLSVAALLCAPVLFSAPAEAKKCPRKVKVEAAEVKGESFSEYAYFRGEIKPLTAELKAAMDAKVKDVFFQAGAEFKAGDTLLTLDAAALNKPIAEAQAAVAKWEKTLKARRNWKERSDRAEKQAVEMLNEAAVKLAALKDKAAQYVIQSPIGGRVDPMYAVPGMDVIGGALLAVAVDESVMKFAIAGDEVATLGDGEKVFVRFESLAIGMNGEVAITGPNQVEIILDNSDRKLSAGLQAMLKILKKEYSDVVVLRQEQVLQDDLGAHVYLAENKRAKRAALTLGAVEDGRVLVLSGLDKGMILITKGVECLQDGKKIKIIGKLPEKAEKKPEPEVAEEEVPVTPPAAAVPAEKRFKAGLNVFYQYVTGEGFSGLYGRAIGGGIEVDYRLNDKMEVWIGGAFSTKSKDLDWADEGQSKYSMFPLSAGLNYYLMRKEKLSAFVGGRVNFVLFKDVTPFEEIKENLIGGGIFGGGNYVINDKFSARATLGFNLVRKNIAMPAPSDFPLDLSNVELKLGIFYSF